MPFVDFAVITGLVEEFEILREIFPTFTEISENASIWYRTRVQSVNGNNYEIVAAFQDQMGPLNAHNLTVRVIKRWDPAYIIVLGIAGSFHKSVRLGDVIVSQQIFYYDLGKVSSDGIRYRPQGYPGSTVLIRQIEALRLDETVFDAWQRESQESAATKARKLRGGGKQKNKVKLARKVLREHRPEIHFGTVASGSLVIADRSKQAELLDLHGKIIGTEMEGAGVFHATYLQELPTPAIVIKGISDTADENKAHLDDERYWRELAKENSVRLTLNLIRRGRIKPLQTDQFTLDTTPGSIADARMMIPDASAPGVSYLAFPNLVVPKGPLTDIQIDIDVISKTGTLEIIKLVIEYLDRSGYRKTETIGIYTMIRGTPEKIVFSVTSPFEHQTMEWIPH
jgi:nucleoside phosphorylase